METCCEGGAARGTTAGVPYSTVGHGEHGRARRERGARHGRHGEHGRHGRHGEHGRHGRHGEHGGHGRHGEHGGHGRHGEHGRHGRHGEHGKQHGEQSQGLQDEQIPLSRPPRRGLRRRGAASEIPHGRRPRCPPGARLGGAAPGPGTGLCPPGCGFRNPGDTDGRPGRPSRPGRRPCRTREPTGATGAGLP